MQKRNKAKKVTKGRVKRTKGTIKVLTEEGRQISKLKFPHNMRCLSILQGIIEDTDIACSHISLLSSALDQVRDDAYDLQDEMKKGVGGDCG